MFKKLLFQLHQFSYENWWMYILLSFTVIIVLVTGKGNVGEIIVLFSINLLGAMCNMLMMSSYKDEKFSEGSIFILTANTLYTFLSLYAWLHDGDMQYIFWQASFLLTGFKAFFLYTYNRNIKYINFGSILLLNAIVMIVLIFHVGLEGNAIVQSFGIAGITLGLSIRHDILRYFYILAGNTFVVLGSLLILISDFGNGNILGVTVAYTLLGFSIMTYNYKILPTYISRLKNI